MRKAYPDFPLPQQILDLKAQQKEQLKKPIALKRYE